MHHFIEYQGAKNMYQRPCLVDQIHIRGLHLAPIATTECKCIIPLSIRVQNSRLVGVGYPIKQKWRYSSPGMHIMAPEMGIVLLQFTAQIHD